MSKWEYTETELWRHGSEKYSIYHVFGLIAVKNAVIAFSEARTGNGGDAGCIHDLVMRRSSDGGRTFEKSVMLLSGADGTCWTNPVPVYDAYTGRLFLFSSDNQGNCQTKNYVMHSDNLGVSWSKNREINAALEEGSNPLPFHLAGPGHGIQLTRGAHAGRMIVPFWHRRYGTEKIPTERGYCVSMLYSDDHGVTWRHTEVFGQKCMANESRIVETHSSLLWIIRPGGDNPCRFESVSTDGGMTWTEPRPQASSPANNCDAGAVSVCAKEGWEDMVLMSRIQPVERRWDMEILISCDGGKTFTTRFAAPTGDAMPGYSDMCVIDEDEPVVGLLHCRSNHVLFSRISLQTLTAGKYENTQRRVWL